MNLIDVSIIIPIYNTPIDYLKKCLDSVLNQDYYNIEVISILDGANKELEIFLEEYKKKDKRIRIFKQENKGEGASRNLGINVSKGKWICFVDSDDWIEKYALKRVIQKIKDIDVDILIFDCYINYKNKEIKNNFYVKEGLLSNKDKDEISMQNIGKGVAKYFPNNCNISVVWAKLYKREFLINNNLRFKENIKRMPDTIFNMEAFEKAKNIYYFNYYGYHYRKNNMSVTNTYYKNLKYDIDFYLKEVNNYINKYNKDKRFKDTYYVIILTKTIQLLEEHLKNEKRIEKNVILDFTKKDVSNADSKYLNFYQKCMKYAIKHKNVFLIKLFIKVKNIIKNLF